MFTRVHDVQVVSDAADLPVKAPADLRAALPWEALFWASDPDQVAPTDGDLVSSWRDASGNGRTVSAATGTEPTFRASVAGLNSQPAIQGASGKFLRAAGFSIPGPYTVLALGYRSTTLGTDAFIGHRADASTNARYLGISSSGKWQFSSGTGLATVANANVGTARLLVGVNRGDATSTIEIDGAVVATGTVGTQSATSLILGQGQNSAGTGTGSHVGYLAVGGIFAGRPEDYPQWADVKAYLASLYGMTIA